MDILIVNVNNSRKKIYQALSKDFSAVDTPFWAALTAGFLRNNNCSVTILDANAKNLDHDETVGIIEKVDPKLVAIVVYSQQANVSTPIMMAVRSLCKTMKAKNPLRKVIITGWHPSALPKRTLEEEDCDYVAQGEGFYTLLGLTKGDPYENIPGLWWKNGGLIKNGAAPRIIRDLDNELSDVAWDLLPFEDNPYRAFNWMCLQDIDNRDHSVSMLTSLGCPFRCDFCAIHATYGEHKVRNWSTAWVMRQIDILVNQYSVKNINFNDELFIYKPDHYLPIAHGIIEKKYNLNICAFARVDVLNKVDQAELEILKKAGFNWFKLGIESCNPDSLKSVSKGSFSTEIIRNVVNKVHEAGIDICANFMFGLPNDDFEKMHENFLFALELQCSFPSFFCTMAIPGSNLYEEAVQNNIPLPETWLGYASQGYDFFPLPTKYLSSADVLAFRDYAFDAYFKNPRYLDMIGKKFGLKAKTHISEMTKIKLKRKLLND